MHNFHQAERWLTDLNKLSVLSTIGFFKLFISTISIVWLLCWWQWKNKNYFKFPSTMDTIFLSNFGQNTKPFWAINYSTLQVLYSGLNIAVVLWRTIERVLLNFSRSFAITHLLVLHFISFYLWLSHLYPAWTWTSKFWVSLELIIW